MSKICDTTLARVGNIKLEVSEALAKLIDVVCLMSTKQAQKHSEILADARAALELLRNWQCEGCRFGDPEGLPGGCLSLIWCKELSLLVGRDFACRSFVVGDR